jgi:hypothetical protein
MGAQNAPLFVGRNKGQLSRKWVNFTVNSHIKDEGVDADIVATLVGKVLQIELNVSSGGCACPPL